MKPFVETSVTLLNRNWPVRVVICFHLLLFFSLNNVHSQNVQLWMEGDGHKQLGESWKYKVTPNFRKLIEAQGWSRLGLKNTFSKKLYPWFAAEVSIDVYYTADQTSADIWEVRPWLATKFVFPKFIDAIHLEKPYFYARLEQRFLWYPEEDTEDQKTRLRLKIGGTFILNNKKLTDKTFYIPWYVEGFHNFNGETFEHHAARDRMSVGLGYVFNPKWRGEFEYIVQGSRNTLEDDLVRTDNIFQLKVNYYFDK